MSYRLRQTSSTTKHASFKWSSTRNLWFPVVRRQLCLWCRHTGDPLYTCGNLMVHNDSSIHIHISITCTDQMLVLVPCWDIGTWHFLIEQYGMMTYHPILYRTSQLKSPPSSFPLHICLLHWQVPHAPLPQIVRVHLRPGTCYVLVLVELWHICGTDTQGDKSLLDAWAEMRRKLSSHSAWVQLYITGRQHGERS